MESPAKPGTTMEQFEAAVPAIRPQLHRYLARMAGSVIDGEDLVQETLLKASRAIASGIGVTSFRAWLFSIAHNTALNFLRSRKSERSMKQEVRRQMPDVKANAQSSGVSGNLRPLMTLSARQRSAVILRDVLGYSASEVTGLTGTSVDSVKSALHRGRQCLKHLDEQDDPQPPHRLAAAEMERLRHYSDCFNAHEFEAIRQMMAEEVHLELVSKEERSGRKDVGLYFTNYSRREDWLLAPGMIERRPAILAFDRNDPAGPPNYFILLDFLSGQLLDIRDFRYARYVMDGAEWMRL